MTGWFMIVAVLWGAATILWGAADLDRLLGWLAGEEETCR